MEFTMFVRFAIVAAVLVSAGLSAAETLPPDTARSFIMGKLFAFNCFDGTHGAGRIYSDGSVAGSIQIRGASEPRYVELPAGTLQVKGQSYCASLRGLPFEPCFDLNRTDSQSFRGSLVGYGLAFCDFTHSNNRPAVRTTWRMRSSRPLQLVAPVVATHNAN
jgi:hypothetical protein